MHTTQTAEVPWRKGAGARGFAFCVSIWNAKPRSVGRRRRSARPAPSRGIPGNQSIAHLPSEGEPHSPAGNPHSTNPRALCEYMKPARRSKCGRRRFHVVVVINSFRRGRQPSCPRGLPTFHHAYAGAFARLCTTASALARVPRARRQTPHSESGGPSAHSTSCRQPARNSRVRSPSGSQRDPVPAHPSPTTPLALPTPQPSDASRCTCGSGHGTQSLADASYDPTSLPHPE